jgi:hypothetical protein
VITLDQILDKGFLRKVHDEIRSMVRANHLTQSLLVKDPTLLADFQFELGDSLRQIRTNVTQGRYRPHDATIVQAAKAPGLRRPLTFLQHDDALVLAAISRAARNAIVRSMPEWVSFGRTEAKGRTKKAGGRDLGSLEPDSFTWFWEWMEYRGLLNVIEKDPRAFLVVSDVANFFPYLDLEILRHSFARQSFLDGEATNLLFFVLEQLLQREMYAPKSKLGLPQDPYDASRILAHFYLGPLDDALANEGKMGRYTRWVDDIAVSVSTELEGAIIIARIQDALQKLGLAPNSVKTRIVTKQQFRAEHLGSYNAILDAAQRRSDNGLLTLGFLRRFDRSLRDFLSAPRTANWTRVLRRYYTQSRRLRNPRLSGLTAAHLREFPAEAGYILDYMCFRPARENALMVEDILKVLQEYGNLYDDLQIYSIEWLLGAPFPDDPILRARIVSRAYGHLQGVGKLHVPSSYIRGLLCYAILKFGGLRALRPLCSILEREPDADPIFSVNAFYVLSSEQSLRGRASQAVSHIRDPRMGRLIRFLSAVQRGDSKAVGIALGLVSSAQTHFPDRTIFRPRALPMLHILKSMPQLAPQLATVQGQTMKKMAAQEPALRDDVMLTHF